MADLGLSSARWQVLAAVAERPATVASIARQLGLTRQSVRRSAQRLVDDGLAAQSANPDHRRAPLLETTPVGERTLAEAGRRHEEWAQRLVGELASAELATACRVLHLLGQRLRETSG